MICWKYIGGKDGVSFVYFGFCVWREGDVKFFFR